MFLQVFFQNDQLCGDMANKFYNVGVAESPLAFNASIVIGGKRKQVDTIMTYTLEWFDMNWAMPIKVCLSIILVLKFLVIQFY